MPKKFVELEYMILPITERIMLLERSVTGKKLCNPLKAEYKNNETFRNKINLAFKIENSICRWCGVRHNYNLDNVEFVVSGSEITITNVDYSGIHYCGQLECKIESKKYNNNSAFKIMMNRNLGSISEAKQWIRNNNSSPFYVENHKTIGGYLDSQRRNQDPIKWNEIITKANYSRSLEGYIDRYGNEVGKLKYNISNKAKALTLKNYTARLGALGPEIFNNMIQNRIKINGSLFGIISYTKNGEMLKSSYEKKFYDHICINELELEYEVDFYYGGRYGHKSDFYFPRLNKHIEIAGMMDKPDYKAKMELKKSLYGETCMIVLPDDIEQTVVYLKQLIDRKLNENRIF